MRVLMTGGAGFIGSNAARRFIERGDQVTLFDNLSRRGAASNLDWLRTQHGAESFRLIHADVREADRLAKAVHGQDVILHYAGQVTVTTSVQNPRGDFEDNALGTFNALEAARLSGSNPIFLYSSTNKVYGGMEDIGLIETETRYAYRDHPHGISESFPLDFHSPYGCSKGTGDQYVRDYARIFSGARRADRAGRLASRRSTHLRDGHPQSAVVVGLVAKDCGGGGCGEVVSVGCGKSQLI